MNICSEKIKTKTKKISSKRKKIHRKKTNKETDIFKVFLNKTRTKEKDLGI